MTSTTEPMTTTENENGTLYSKILSTTSQPVTTEPSMTSANSTYSTILSNTSPPVTPELSMTSANSYSTILSNTTDFWMTAANSTYSTIMSNTSGPPKTTELSMTSPNSTYSTILSNTSLPVTTEFSMTSTNTTYPQTTDFFSTVESGVVGGESDVVGRLREAGVTAKLVLNPISFFMGLVGNIMVILIIRRFIKKGSSSSMDWFYLALALNDLCVNVTGSLREWLGPALDVHIDSPHDVVCRCSVFVFNVATGSSAWILVALTTQRALVVLSPHRVGLLCTPKRSAIIIVVIEVFFCLAYLQVMYGFGVDPESGRCTVVDGDYLTFLTEVWMNIDIFLFSALPFLFLLVNNGILIFKLRQTVSADHFSATASQQAARKKKANSVTVTAIAVSVAFVVFTLPLGLVNVIAFKFRSSDDVQPDPEQLALQGFLNNLFYSLAYFNYAVNFYLYCLTGTRFRDECRLLLCCDKSG